MMINNEIKLHEYLSDLWEYEREQNRIEHQDENGELDTNDDIFFLSVGMALDGTIEYRIFLNNNKVERKAVPSELLPLFNTSIQNIRVNIFGYSLETDLHYIMYKFDGRIEAVEER